MHFSFVFEFLISLRPTPFLLKTLVVGRRQQSESIEVALNIIWSREFL